MWHCNPTLSLARSYYYAKTRGNVSHNHGLPRPASRLLAHALTAPHLPAVQGAVCNILVATSVAARGLDVAQLVLVVNYDCPNHHEDYVHRCWAGALGDFHCMAGWSAWDRTAVPFYAQC